MSVCRGNPTLMVKLAGSFNYNFLHSAASLFVLFCLLMVYM